MPASEKRTVRAAFEGGHRTFQQSPSDSIRYAIDWTDVLRSGETVGSAAWTYATGITGSSESTTTTTTETRLTSGTVDSNVLVLCAMTTTDGQAIQRGFTIQVRSPVL